MPMPKRGYQVRAASGRLRSLVMAESSRQRSGDDQGLAWPDHSVDFLLTIDTLRQVRCNVIRLITSVHD